MGFLQRLRGTETFDLARHNGHNPTFGIDIDPALVQGDVAGLMFSDSRVSRNQALKVPAVLRARNIIAGTLGGLPIHVRNTETRKIESPTLLLDQIDPDLPNIVTMAATYEDLLFESVSWWRVLDLDPRGFPSRARHVSVERVYASPAGVFIDGVPVPDSEVIRFDSPNPPLLKHGARAIKTCLMLDLTAKLYAESPTPLGYFTPKEGVADLPEEEIEVLLTKWEQTRRVHAYGYVGTAWDLNNLQFDAEQIQLADQRQHAVLEIARATGIDPEDLGVSTTSRTYQNAETRRQDQTLFTFGAYTGAVEQRLSMRDVLPTGYGAKVNFDAFLRPDKKTRYETYEIGQRIGVDTIDENRDLEDKPRLGTGESSSPMELATLIQKIYLGVGVVLSAQEAREIANRAGAGLTGELEPEETQ